MNSQDAHSFYDPLVQGSSCSTPQFHASEKNKLFWGWVHVPHSCSSRRFGTVRPVFNQQSEGWSCGFEDREGGEEKKKQKRRSHFFSSSFRPLVTQQSQSGKSSTVTPARSFSVPLYSFK